MNQIPGNAPDMYRTIFPNIGDKDIEAFVYSKPEHEPYELTGDSREKEGIAKGSITKYRLFDSTAYPEQEETIGSTHT
jgi:hypothetical protein